MLFSDVWILIEESFNVVNQILPNLTISYTNTVRPISYGSGKIALLLSKYSANQNWLGNAVLVVGQHSSVWDRFNVAKESFSEMNLLREMKFVLFYVVAMEYFVLASLP